MEKELNERLLAPEMVEKLVRHFGQRAKVRVLIDYSPDAVPWASPDGVVSIPAWMRADQIKPLLGAILHETGHIEFDAPDNKLLLASGMHKSPIYYMFYNVALDARLDARRLAQYPGAQMMYDAIWTQEQVSKNLERYGGMARASNVLRLALAEAIGMGHAIAPKMRENVEKAGMGPLVERLTDVLKRAEHTKKGVEQLVAEVVCELAEAGPWEPEIGCTPWEVCMVQKFGKKTYEECRGDAEKVLEAARASMRKFLEKEKGAPKKLGEAGYGTGLMDAIAWITGVLPPNMSAEKVSKITGLNPMEDANYKSPDPEDVNRAIATFFREAVAAFVAAVEDVPAPEEYPYMIDQQRLAMVMTDPDEVLIGDRTETVASAAVDLIVDVSGSMYDQDNARAKVRRGMEAARLWVETAKDVGAKRVKIGFVPFASKAARNLDFKNILDVSARRFTLKAIKNVDLGGGTNLEAAIAISEDGLRKVHAKRKAIVVISDGEVTQEAIDKCRKMLRSDIRLAVLTVVHENASDEQVAELVSTDVFNYVAKSREATETAFAKALLDACARGFDD